VHHFGKVGQYHYKIARAEDDRPAHPNRIRKSIGAENSYDPDLSERAQIETALEEEADTLLRQLDSQRTVGRTLTLKVKYADYQQVTRSRTLLTLVRDRSLILDVAHELLDMTALQQKAIRLIGLTISNLIGETQEHYVQLCPNV
jgi:DNA polymerase-4